MTPKHEYTSWKVSRIASKVMRMARHEKKSNENFFIWANQAGTLTLEEAEALGGSCLTQAKDRLKKKAAAKRKASK